MPSPFRTRRPALLACALLVATACVAPKKTMQPNTDLDLDPPPPPRARDEIVVCGQRVHVGAPVVLWFEHPGYDAYQLVPDPKAPKPKPAELAEQAPLVKAYAPGREGTNPDGTKEARVAPGSRDLGALRSVIDQFVLHYDVCGTSRTCHRVLRERGLSVHFMLDLDGTIYQTLDLRDTAWHATKANPRSIGIEIANMGAYAKADAPQLKEWYARDAAGTLVTIPERFGDGGLRHPGFVARPARPDPVRGTIHGVAYVQYDFTPEQYASLAKLTAALCRTFPELEPDAPRRDGRVMTTVLPDDAWKDFRGVLGHYHVQANKQDPGPAFDWERYLRLVREELGVPAASP